MENISSPYKEKKNQFVVYLKFKFNWASCLQSGNTVLKRSLMTSEFDLALEVLRRLMHKQLTNYQRRCLIEMEGYSILNNNACLWKWKGYHLRNKQITRIKNPITSPKQKTNRHTDKKHCKPNTNKKPRSCYMQIRC